MLDTNDILGLVLGGGKGTRLYPLTEKRAKPAVPLAGKYRLIDIPISNCIHSGIHKIAILTQFQSASLHRHIARTYRRDVFSGGWVEILAADQSFANERWYQGTADAVRQKWVEIRRARTKYVLILAGDHLYNMDYRKFVSYHIDTGADLTLAVQPVSAEEAPGFGILKRNADGRIVSFTEKPAADRLSGLESLEDPKRPFLGSMGIYVVSTALLEEMLREPGVDFGNHLVPNAMQKQRVMGFIYDGYWADIGTVGRYYEVNIDLTRAGGPLNLFDPGRPIFTRPRFLPPSRVSGSKLDEVLLADGCCITDAEVCQSVVGLRSTIQPGAKLVRTVMMGADDYETDEELEGHRRTHSPAVGIGENSIVEGAILDKNVRIGRNVRIRKLDRRPDGEGEGWVSRDGIVIIPKGTIIPDGTVI